MTDKMLTPDEAQYFAERSLKGAMMALFHTFNLTDDANAPYSFDSGTRDKVMEHCRALMALFARGKLTPKLSATAEDDGDFQRFIQTVLRAPARRRGARGRVRKGAS